MNAHLLQHLSPSLQKAVLKNVQDAMDEDLGTEGFANESLSTEGIASGDLTAQLVPQNQTISATIISREAAVICGIPWVDTCFDKIDSGTLITWKVKEGESVKPNQVLCQIKGNARSILTAERCALNFLQSLSATATITKHFVDAIKGTNAKILDTRKTIPGMRLAQKYAVTIGGGCNQRLGLYDGILIKENHIAAAGSIAQVLKEAGKINPNTSIQIEVENLQELSEALQAGAKLILLDNFDCKTLMESVKLNAGRAILEASGGISIENVREIALTGVDRISIGSLTKNIAAIDLSLRFNY
ncbi:MAG: carboxylating nicotinate-nucleotide diphosphorylase [Methylophilaceae bacterium]